MLLRNRRDDDITNCESFSFREYCRILDTSNTFLDCSLLRVHEYILEFPSLGWKDDFRSPTDGLFSIPRRIRSLL